jgi:uncharacterized protein DUF6923
MTVRLLAASVVEQALACINESEGWRDQLQGTTVEGELSGATFTWTVTDPDDGDLTDDPSQPAELTVRVEIGDAVTVLRVSIEAEGGQASSVAATVWGVDQQDGELFAIEDYYGTSREFTSYGRLKYQSGRRLADLGHGVSAFVLDADQNAYMVYDRRSGRNSGQVLLRFDVAHAQPKGNNEVDIVGSLGIRSSVTGLALDPDTGDLYALAQVGRSSTPDHLVKISKSTGAVTTDLGAMTSRVSSIGAGQAMVFDPEGNLYVVDAARGQLCRVDKSNGRVLEICDAETKWMGQVEALAWDSANGRLLGALGNPRTLMHLTMGDGDNIPVTTLGPFGLHDVRGMGLAPGQAGGAQEAGSVRPGQSTTAIGLVVR